MPDSMEQAFKQLNYDITAAFILIPVRGVRYRMEAKNPGIDDLSQGYW